MYTYSVGCLGTKHILLNNVSVAQGVEIKVTDTEKLLK